MQDARRLGHARRWIPMAVALAALWGVAVLFIVAVLGTQQAHRAAEEDRLRDTARALSSAIDAQIGSYIAALTALAGTNLPIEPEVSRERLAEHLGSAARDLDGVITLTGPAPDFPMLFLAGPVGLGQSEQRRPAALAAEIHPLVEEVFRERRPVVSHVFWGPFSGQQRMAIYVPVIRGDAVRYVLALSVEPNAFQRILERQGFAGGGRAAVADSRDRIAALTNFPPSYAVGTGISDFVARTVRGQDHALVSGIVRDGSYRAVAAERLTRAPGWYVVISYLESELDALAWHQLRWVQIAGGAFVVLVVLVVWIGGRQVMRDVEAEAAALRAGRAEIERLHAGLPAVIFLRAVAADGTSRLIYRSGDIEAVTGWTPDEAKDLATLSEKSTLTVAGEIRAFRRVLHVGSGSSEYLMSRPRGEPQWVRSTVRTIEVNPDGGGLIVGYIINVHDEVLARNAAREAQEDLERTLSHAPIAVYRGIIGADGSLRPIYRSPGFESVTGWPSDAIAERGIFSVLAPGDTGLRGRVIAALRETGEWRADVDMQRPDGSHFWGRVHSRVIDRRPDESLEVIGFIQDVTQEIAAEQGAQRAQRLASLGEFSSGVAHELRQPLATMMMAAENAQLALELNEKADAGMRLETIVAQAERATALIEHLRLFARGTPRVEHVERLSLDAVAASVAELVRRSLEPHQIRIDLLPHDPLPAILANRIGLEQVIVNLIYNARDALSDLPDGKRRRITLAMGANSAAGTATLTVADTGGGIPPDVLRRLFEPFVTSKGPDKGTGIGLSICFALMRSMGGMIEGTNGPDGGAVFTLTLKFAKPSDRLVCEGAGTAFAERLAEPRDI